MEDDEAARELYQEVLQVAGYEVSAVADGIDALHHLESTRPACVVLDLMLPTVGGLDVYDELRAHPETQTLPVVIVTGSDVRALEPDGGRVFLRKPFDPETLVAAVDRGMRRRRRR